MVKPISTKEQIKSDIAGFEIVRPVELENREKVATQMGVVIGVGNTAWHAFDKKDNPAWKPWVTVGDTIIFAKYAGKLVEDPVTKEEFMVINDEDVQALVTGVKDIFEE